MKEWNRNEWQGKRKDQVDYSYKITLYTLLIGLIAGIIYNIYFFFK